MSSSFGSRILLKFSSVLFIKSRAFSRISSPFSRSFLISIFHPNILFKFSITTADDSGSGKARKESASKPMLSYFSSKNFLKNNVFIPIITPSSNNCKFPLFKISDARDVVGIA